MEKRTVQLVIFLLIAGILYMYWTLHNKQDVVTVAVHMEQIDSTKIADLETKYAAALHDFDLMRNQNASLDSILEKRKEEILNMKSVLEDAKKAGKLKEADYQASLNKLHQLIEDLKNQISQLEMDNSILIQEKGNLENDLNDQVVSNEHLKNENSILSTKAGLLKALNIVGTGAKGKTNGQEVNTNSSKKAERLKICFDIDENKSAALGNKTFLLVLLAPNGSVLFDKDNGSGKFTLGDTHKIADYTTKNNLTYNGKFQNVCMYWGTNSSVFEKGIYKLEIFQDGYSVGKDSFELK